MTDDDPEDLDTLTRADLAELDGPAYTVACVLDEWRARLHGITSGQHGAGLFLDLLAAEGWRVTQTDVPSLETLLTPCGPDDPIIDTQWGVRWPKGTVHKASDSYTARQTVERHRAIGIHHTTVVCREARTEFGTWQDADEQVWLAAPEFVNLGFVEPGATIEVPPNTAGVMWSE
jgi:hypothetical protein